MEISSDCMGYQNYGGNKNHDNRKQVKVQYIGTKSTVLVTGEYYTYKELAKVCNMCVKTMQHRVWGDSVGLNRYANDNTIRPLFTKSDGVPLGGGNEELKNHTPSAKCKHEAQNVSTRWLNIKLTTIDPNYTNRQWR